MTLVYEVVALRTRVGVFEVLDDAGLAECVQAFRHGGGVDKVTMADLKACSFYKSPSTSEVTYWLVPPTCLGHLEQAM